MSNQDPGDALDRLESEGVFTRAWHEGRLEGAQVMGSAAIRRLRQTGAAGDLKALWITDYDEASWQAALTFLAEGCAPALEKLGLEFEHFEGPPCPAETAQALARALPRLEGLALVGRHLFAALAHPGLKRLALSGYDAIESLTRPEAAPGFPSLVELDLACYPGTLSHLSDGAPEGPGAARALPTLLSRRTLPALRALDLSRCEPGEKAPFNLGGQVRLYELLPRLDVLPSLTHLRLPSLRRPEDVAALRGLLPSLPGTRVEIARDYGSLSQELTASAQLVLPTPVFWPPSDQVHGREAVHVELRHEDAYGTDVDLSGLVRALDAQAATLDASARAAWERFWDALDGLTYTDDAQGADRPFAFDDLLAAIAGLGPDFLSASPRWQELHAKLAQHRACCAGASVQLRRYWGW